MRFRLSCFWLLFLALLSVRPVSAFSPASDSPKTEAVTTYSVYIFLSETCPISQFYTLTLKELHKEFAGKQFTFTGIFPNSTSTPETIAEFKKKHELPFELKSDPEQKITAALKASVTPEVVVQQTKTGAIVYKGRIDDAYFRVGKRRAKVTEPDLKNALTQIRNNQPISKPETDAVGCYITLKP